MFFELIGYSGHSYVVLDSIKDQNLKCLGYYDLSFNNINPYNLKYLGLENTKTSDLPIFIGIGDNKIRREIAKNLKAQASIRIIDNTSLISSKALIHNELVYIGKRAIVNAQSRIHKGVILNTGSVVEHDVDILEYSHVGPNATICGGVRIGENVLVGAGAVIQPNLSIESNVIVGAGAVVTKNLKANAIYVGNPAKLIRQL